MVVSNLEESIVNEALKEFRKESMSIDDAWKKRRNSRIEKNKLKVEKLVQHSSVSRP
jgi:hypothetical protein